MAERFTNNEYADACRIDNLKEAAKNNYVVSDLLTTANDPADMDVDISTGVIKVSGNLVDITGVTKTVSASDGSNDRYDIISLTTAGAIVYTAGTPAANPLLPNLPVNSILSAYIFVKKSIISISSGDVFDVRIITAAPGFY